MSQRPCSAPLPSLPDSHVAELVFRPWSSFQEQWAEPVHAVLLSCQPLLPATAPVTTIKLPLDSQGSDCTCPCCPGTLPGVGQWLPQHQAFTSQPGAHTSPR